MIYVHVPFCKSFCTYCDFYSEICSGKESKKVQSLYVQGVLDEIKERKEEIEDSKTPKTLYFGGGTPSVLGTEQLKTITDALGPADYEEFTVEVNPDDVTKEFAAGLVKMGVNRISMGVQSLDDKILKWMKRRHDCSSALNAYHALRDTGVRNLSIDLIFGLSQLSDGLWRSEVRRIIELRPEHISAYALSVEENSGLQRLIEKGAYKIADDELYRRQYDILCSELASAGYRHYEISNFALPGFEAIHNSAYWSGHSYVGLGPGAHSYDAAGRVRSRNTQTPYGWSRESETLTPRQLAIEEIMLRLRTSEGMPLRRLEELSEEKAIARSLRLGAIVCTGGQIRIPEDRFFVSEDIISDLIV